MQESTVRHHQAPGSGIRGACAKGVVLLIGSLLFSAASQAAADLLPVEAFARKPEISYVNLSPSGEAIAFMRPVEGSYGLFYLKISEMEGMQGLVPATNKDIVDYGWIDEDRLWYQLAYDYNYSAGLFVVDRKTGHTFKMDKEIDHNVRSSLGVSSKRSFEYRYYPFDVIGIDPDEKTLKVVTYYLKGDNSSTLVYRDYTTEEGETIEESPVDTLVSWETDGKDQVLLKSELDVKDIPDLEIRHGRYYWRPSEDDEWRLLDLAAGQWPIHISAETKTLYIGEIDGNGRDVIRDYNLETGEVGDLHLADPVYDVSGSLFLSERDPDSRLAGVGYEA